MMIPPMEFLVYCRDRPGTAALREELNEAHQAFMDRYANLMIARGPTLTGPGADEATGSLHILDLPDAAAALAFAEDEPYRQGGVFQEILVRRWRNGLGRTMWDYDGDPVANQRFFVLGQAAADGAERRERVLSAHRAYLDDPVRAGRFIARGALLSDDGGEWVGAALLIEVPDRAAAEALVAADPFVQAGLYASLEIHDWRFGGRDA
jgi:uncharacterized protein